MDGKSKPFVSKNSATSLSYPVRFGQCGDCGLGAPPNPDLVLHLPAPGAPGEVGLEVPEQR